MSIGPLLMFKMISVQAPGTFKIGDTAVCWIGLKSKVSDAEPGRAHVTWRDAETLVITGRDPDTLAVVNQLWPITDVEHRDGVILFVCIDRDEEVERYMNDDQASLPWDDPDNAPPWDGTPASPPRG